MVVAEEFATKDWYGSVTKRYRKPGNSPYAGKIVPLTCD